MGSPRFDVNSRDGQGKQGAPRKHVVAPLFVYLLNDSGLEGREVVGGVGIILEPVPIFMAPTELAWARTRARVMGAAAVLPSLSS